MGAIVHRRHFLATSLVAATARPTFAKSAPKRLLLRSSWQTVNIGDIAHTPGMLALLETHLPDTAVTLWPNALSPEVTKLLLQRFPKLTIATTKAEQEAALAACDFVLHGSGPGLVGIKEIALAKTAGKPYGFGGVTLTDDEIKTHRDLLAGAKFLFCRDTDSLTAFRDAKIAGPASGFGPDATFALDLRDDVAAGKLLREFDLPAGEFLCAVPRLRWTPYWEIHPERTKPNPQRSAVNEAFAERDHAKLRMGIEAWVNETGKPVLLCPEMTYALPRLKPLLFDPLPAAVKKHVRVLERYWLTAEAASVYAKAACVASFEQHSPIMAIAAGTPAVLLRQPTDTRKGRMWYDLGMTDWVYEIDATTGDDVAKRLLAIAKDLPGARKSAGEAKKKADAAMARMAGAI